MQISKDETSAPISHFFYFLDQAKEHFLSFGCDREFLETVIQRLRCSKIDQASPDGIYRLLTLDFSDNDAEFQKLIFYTGYILSGIIVKSIRYAVLVSRHNLSLS